MPSWREVGRQVKSGPSLDILRCQLLLCLSSGGELMREYKKSVIYAVVCTLLAYYTIGYATGVNNIWGFRD
jgi:hypothetical protein